MGIFKRLGKFSLISAGAAFVAPRLFSDGLDGLRPLAKEVIKGGNGCLRWNLGNSDRGGTPG